MGGQGKGREEGDEWARSEREARSGRAGEMRVSGCSPTETSTRLRKQGKLTKDDLAAIEHANQLIPWRLILVHLAQLPPREIQEPLHLPLLSPRLFGGPLLLFLLLLALPLTLILTAQQIPRQLRRSPSTRSPTLLLIVVLWIRDRQIEMTRFNPREEFDPLG